MPSSLLTRIALVFPFALLLGQPACAANADPAPSAPVPATVLISKTVPASVAKTQAPDTDSEHYRTLNGTHFSYRCHVPYTLPTGEAAIEVCDVDPVTLQILSWPETEVINIVSGEVTVTEPDGKHHTYVKGDVFVLPQGFKGIWQQGVALSKVVVRHPLYWKD